MRTLVIVVLVIAGAILFVVAVVASIGLILVASEAIAILLAGAVFFGIVALIADALTGAPAACGLVSRTLLPDKCGGACPAGQTCTAATTGPYPAFLGRFAPSTQALTCACTPTAAGAAGGGGGAPGGTGAPGSGAGTPGSPDDGGG